MEHLVSKILKEILRFDPSGLSIDKLHGDASYRTYYRLKLPNSKPPSIILMEMPKDGRASVSEEITNLKEPPKELTYLNVQRYLKSCDIRVPDVYFYDKENQLLFIEDLGSNHFEEIVKSSLGDQKLNLYRQAVDLLVSIQIKTAKNQNPDCIAFQRSFDKSLYLWEFEHFLEYGIEVRQNTKIKSSCQRQLMTIFEDLSGQLANLPYVFTHRDFQSKNLLIIANGLAILDFQDALLGPPLYDLVALLRDSYVVLDQDMMYKLLEYYWSYKKDLPPFVDDLKKLKDVFDMITLQRKLKDAGRFVYIDRVKGNPKFLTFIPATLGYVRSVLENNADYKRLHKLLKPYVPELGEIKS